MHVVNCHVERTYNLGNYESLKVGFEAVLGEQDRPLDVSRDLELLCNQHFENRTAKTSQTSSAAPSGQAQPTTPPQQRPPIHQGQIELAFPEDLRSLVSFEVKGDNHIIKPKQFLGSENFAKISAVVRSINGQYISAGKESHWRVPR